jgi:serine protease
MLITRGILTLGILSCVQTSFANSYDDIHIIVKYKQPPVAMQSLQNQIGSYAQIPVQSRQQMAGNTYALVFSNQDIKSAIPQKDDASATIIKRLQNDLNVAYAVKDRKGSFKPLPKEPEDLNPPRISHEAQWDEFSRPGGIMLESAPGKQDGAWAYTTGLSSPPIVVAVLDTGIANHNSLTNNLLKDANGKIWGWNFAANNNIVENEVIQKGMDQKSQEFKDKGSEVYL